ncbi:phosphoadenosine phosphosulfate reductase [Celeribacter sp. PS-C1]|uniref:phosphoadenosine phosphosulfate reductase n=1 Tax=Celeribacter sp. PS-C1 TaxID=2820813 RepID=UPI001CA4CF50|nr:phosphoadenosine phosphosulfate reductase [Celeribacter sp. PS-C1]MBW6418070.1 phosphoadenosine phosphosulfate reductase [Celeribacter sp. PS-C1]
MSEQETELQKAMQGIEDISDFARDEWCEALEELSTDLGYYQTLGDHHSVAFLDEKPRLLVTFESYERTTERTRKGYPVGMSLAGKHGWSSLTLLSHGPDETGDWFRSKHIYGYFDRLVDEGFFEDFDQVVFYGAGACGYAAAAFSVVAPGATVITIAPQATLNGRLASWDSRFPKTRRMDFTTRYGFAPDMLEGAEKAYVLYDPKVEADAMHAALFNAPHISRVPCRLFGVDPEYEIMEIDALDPILEAAMESRLTQRVITQELRKRRTHQGYQRRLLAELAPKSRPYQTAFFCRYVLNQRRHAPRFRRALNIAMEALESEGKTLPPAKPAAKAKIETT